MTSVNSLLVQHQGTQYLRAQIVREQNLRAQNCSRNICVTHRDTQPRDLE